MQRKDAMEFTVSPADDGRYILTTVTGDITRESAGVFIRASIEVGGELGTRTYLYDMIDARNRETVMGNVRQQRDDLPELDRRLRDLRIAVLIAPGDRSHDFYVAFAQSQGIDMTLFTDRAEALAFLRTE